MKIQLLKGKNAVITGCNRGIGKAILTEYANNGANCICCIRNKSDEFENFCKKLANENKVKIDIVLLDLKENKNVSDSVKKIFTLTKKN